MSRHYLIAVLFAFLPMATLGFHAVSAEVGDKSAPEEISPDESAAATPSLRGVVVLRVSEKYLEELFARDIDKRTPVTRVVLGTRARGTAHTSGRADVDTKPDRDDAAFYVRINGHTHARTVGRNGPAIIHSCSYTSWTAQKIIRFDGEKFVTSPATISSQTRITPLGAGSVLPGLRGRIVSRVASRRAVEANSTAERITGQNTDKRVQSDVDRVVDSQIQKLNDRIQNRSLMALLLPNLKQAGIEFSTSSNCVNISFGGSSAPEAKILPVEGLEPSDTELWFQSGLLTGTNEEIPEVLGDAGAWLSEKLPYVELPGVDLGNLNALPFEMEMVKGWVVFRSKDLPTPTVQVTAKPILSE